MSNRLQTAPRHIPALLALLLALLATACSQDTEQQAGSEPAVPEATIVDTSEASTRFWQAGELALNSTLEQTLRLRQATGEFLAAPRQANLENVQSQWLAVQQSWHRFYFFAQMGISDAQTFGALNELIFRIAAHPIQPGYLDYFGPYPYSGLVHDISVPLTRENLLDQHGLTDAEDVVLGLYAIEFMLKGEHQTRPASDYTAVSELTAAQREQGFRQIAETPNQRRREMLALQTELLEQSLGELQALWLKTAKDNSPRALWFQLPATAQKKLMVKNLERTLTQILLDLVAASPNPQSTSGDTRYDSSSSAPALAAEIESLLIAEEWLNEPARENFNANLSFARDRLQTEMAGDSWSQVYDKLKASLQVCCTGIALN